MKKIVLFAIWLIGDDHKLKCHHSDNGAICCMFLSHDMCCFLFQKESTNKKLSNVSCYLVPKHHRPEFLQHCLAKDKSMYLVAL